MASVLSVLETDYTKIQINVINKGPCQIRVYPQMINYPQTQQVTIHIQARHLESPCDTNTKMNE